MLTETTETARIADQLRRLYAGPSWLGPALKAILSDIDEVRAHQRTVPGMHTIGELVLHLTAWCRIARERLSATRDRDADAAEDWPPDDGSWKDSLAALDAEVYALEAAIRGLSDQRLPQRAPAKEEQTFYQLLHGVVQHAAYHAGQITLLKKFV